MVHLIILNLFRNPGFRKFIGIPEYLPIEKIEIITQPGAEFPATSGGAILNIITNKKKHTKYFITYSPIKLTITIPIITNTTMFILCKGNGSI